MIDKKTFFSQYRVKLDKTLTQKEVNAIDLFIDNLNENFNYFSLQEWAYILATVYHETAQTFEPVIEAFWKTEEWRKRNFRYYPYFGRGMVQLTWKFNYEYFSKRLGIDLVNKPDLALDYNTSFKILIIGCKEGIFTKKKLSDYIKDGKANYTLMRYVINGRDKRELIADYAKEFERILKLSIK
jgi:hypothetical protein